MNLATRRHLIAARHGRLHDTASGATLIRAVTTSGHSASRAQLKVVEQLLKDGWIVRLGDGRYEATDLGLAELAKATS